MLQRWFFTVLLLLSIGATALADTYVYVHNNTPFGFNVQIEQPSGLALPSEYWKRGASTIAPGKQRLELMRTNRDSGVKSGKYYEFRLVLTPQGGGTPFGLKLRLKGTTFNSDLWQSVDGDPWFDDRKTHSQAWNAGAMQFNVKYRAYFTGGADDVEFILQYRYPTLSNTDKNELHLLTYNTYMRPTSLFVNGQSARTPLLAEWVKQSNYDAILFNELFDDDIRSRMVSLLRSEFPYATRVVGTDRGTEQDGGVILVSRWPIVAEDQRLYGKTSAGSDSMADKGVLYACIDKRGRKYHLFGSHTQSTRGASDWPVDSGVRTKQFGIVRQFIDSKNIPENEPVIIGGDLNVDKGRTSEYNSLLATLNVSAPSYTGHGKTWDPTINLCADAGAPEYLDYLLADNKHLRPLEVRNEARIARSSEEWKALATDRARWDLSDHFPVYGYFKFPLIRLTVPLLKDKVIKP